MYEAIVKGDYTLEPGLPESFNVSDQGAPGAVPERRAHRRTNRRQASDDVLAAEEE